MEVVTPYTTDPAPSETPILPLESGQKIFGRFTLLQVVGHGRCSTAWLADEPRFNREVVLKIFQSSNQEAAETEQKLWREFLRRVRGLNSPNIVAAMEFLRDGQWVALANPPVSGGSLAQNTFLAGKKMPFAECERILQAVGLAMVAAHEKGRIIHGNLNAYNILLNAEKKPKITDFGFHPPVDMRWDEPSNPDLAWKLACVTPERRQGGDPSQNDDLYAFATIAFQLFTHSNPPQGDVSASQSALESLGNIPKKWQVHLGAALAHNPEERPASIKDFLQQLDLYERATDISSTSSKTRAIRAQKPPNTRPDRDPQGSRLFLYFTIFCAIAMPISLGWLIYQGREADKKWQSERAEIETAELTRRKAAKAMETESNARNDRALTSIPRSPLLADAKPTPTPEPTPLKINTGAMDFYQEGLTKFKAGDASGALESYSLALVLQPTWPQLLEARAEAFTAEKQLAEALEEYNKALELEPTRISSLLGRAKVFTDLGQPEKARADFEAVLSVQPGNVTAKTGLDQLPVPAVP